MTIITTRLAPMLRAADQLQQDLDVGGPLRDRRSDTDSKVATAVSSLEEAILDAPAATLGEAALQACVAGCLADYFESTLEDADDARIVAQLRRALASIEAALVAAAGPEFAALGLSDRYTVGERRADT